MYFCIPFYLKSWWQPHGNFKITLHCQISNYKRHNWRFGPSRFTHARPPRFTNHGMYFSKKTESIPLEFSMTSISHWKNWSWRALEQKLLWRQKTPRQWLKETQSGCLEISKMESFAVIFNSVWLLLQSSPSQMFAMFLATTLVLNLFKVDNKDSR